MDFFAFWLIPFFCLPQICTVALLFWWAFTAKPARAPLRAWGLTMIALGAWGGVAMSVIANTGFSFFDGWKTSTGVILMDSFWLGALSLIVWTNTHLRRAGLAGLLMIVLGWVNTGNILEDWIYPLLGKDIRISITISERDDFYLVYFGFWALVLCGAVYFFGEMRKETE